MASLCGEIQQRVPILVAQIFITLHAVLVQKGTEDIAIEGLLKKKKSLSSDCSSRLSCTSGQLRHSQPLQTVKLTNDLNHKIGWGIAFEGFSHVIDS
jgi:hypothetical protein